MTIKTVLPLMVTLAISIWLSAYAGEDPKPANAGAPQLASAEAPKPANAVGETEAEAKARADYEAAEKAAQEAAAAVGPLLDAMKKADVAYAEARKQANAARQKATDAKNLAGEPGVKELQQAEANLPAAVQALTEATNAKPPLDQALADAKAAAAPLQEAYNVAEKEAKEAEAAAKAAADAANKLDTEAKKATAQATAKRKAADTAKAALEKAKQGEQKLQNQVDEAPKLLAEAEAQKKPADDALAAAKNQVAAATAAHQAADQAAQAAEANAKAVSADAAKPEAEKKQAADDAAAKRKAADEAKAALAQAQQAEQAAQAPAAAAAKLLARATAQKKVAEAGLAGMKKQVENATAALAAAEKAAQEFEKLAEEMNQAVAQAAAKRKAAEDPANQAAQEAAKDILALDAAAKQTAGVAAAKRKVANEAKATLDPKAKALEQAAIQATRAAEALTRAEARKKLAEETLANLKERIAAAKQTHEADEKAAQEAEAVAAPMQTEAERTRTAWRSAVDVANEKRNQAQQAKAAWYRLVAARQVVNLMESPDPPKPANGIDHAVFAKLKALNVEPGLCSDAVFIRRAYLDLTGKLPSADEARAFIQNPDQNKRAALIDHLLEQPAHFDYWAMKWSDILRVKAEFPVKVWPNGAQAYHRWIWESLAQNKPYDQFARELLTSSGSNFRVGPVNFYRAIQNRTPEGIAASVALALMGTRVHPWPEERRAGMAAFFTQIGYKPTSEWKEEVVFWDPLNSVAVPGSVAPGIDNVAKSVTATNQIPQALAQPLSESGPLEAAFPDGAKTTVPPGRDPREVFAEWLIRPENPWFAKTIANRTWAWAMGRGIIHEADDIRDDNPPSNPELLAYLEKELVSSGWNLKHLKRLIFTSPTYQLSPIARSDKPEAAANFASYLMRRVEAEVLIDALNEITGSADLYTSAVPEPVTYIPDAMNAVQVGDGSVSSSFLALFGRSGRDTGMETERVNELASPQWLYMLNSATIQNKLQSGPKLAALIAAGGTPQEVAERLYLTILSRLPTDADVKTLEEYAKIGVTKGRDMWIDLSWALVNSPEFLLRH